MAFALFVMAECSVIVTVASMVFGTSVCVGGDLRIKFCDERGRVSFDLFDAGRTADKNLATVDNR